MLLAEGTRWSRTDRWCASTRCNDCKPRCHHHAGHAGCASRRRVRQACLRDAAVRCRLALDDGPRHQPVVSVAACLSSTCAWRLGERHSEDKSRSQDLPIVRNMQNSLGRAWDEFDAYLFDVDGTLMNCTDAVHYFAFNDAISAVAGRPLT